MTGSSAPGTGAPGHHLVLLGTSAAHLRFLAGLNQHPLVGVTVTLVTTHTRHVHAQQLADIVAGQVTLEHGSVALQPLLQHSGVRWLTQPVVGLDPANRSLRLHDGGVLHYDWLSLAETRVQERAAVEAALPGARAHGLFVHPLEVFCELWPRVVALGASRKLRVAVVGASQTALELALAMTASLPGAAITLITANEPLAADLPPAVRQRLLALLKTRNITLLQDAAAELRADEIQLGSGARLACDVPVLAGLAQAPAWLARSGLALDEQGHIEVDAQLRAVSHPSVFVLSDSGQPSARATQTLAANLRAVTDATPLQSVGVVQNRLHFATTGARHAVAGWGNWVAQGHWVWGWKRKLQRAPVAALERAKH
jgi:selenide,water dikinase